MPYTLKASGIATRAKVVLGVNDNGVITEFVNGWTPGSGITVHPNVTTGSATFRGSSGFRYFQTTEAAGGVPEAISFTTNPLLTTRTVNVGLAMVAIMAGCTWLGSRYPFQLQRDSSTTSTASEGIRLTVSGTVRPECYIGGAARATGTTEIPTDGSTPFSMAAQYLHSGTQYGIGAGGQCWYAAASSAGSAITAFEPASPSGAGFQPGGVPSLTGVAGIHRPDDNASPGAAVNYAATGKYHLWMVFDSLLTLAEYQALHDDPVGTLFDVSAPTFNPVWARGANQLVGA